MVSVVYSHTNATSERWHLWEIDLGFALNSTIEWRAFFIRESLRERVTTYWSESTASS